MTGLNTTNLLIRHICASADEMQQIGRVLARVLLPRDVVFLKGDLGAGKTTLVSGVVAELMGDQVRATSPTFTLAHVWETPKGPLWHLDLWRLKSPEELWEIGLEEALGSAMTLIEWPERLGDYPLQPTFEITIDIQAGTRVVTIRGPQERAYII